MMADEREIVYIPTAASADLHSIKRAFFLSNPTDISTSEAHMVTGYASVRMCAYALG